MLLVIVHGTEVNADVPRKHQDWAMSVQHRLMTDITNRYIMYKIIQNDNGINVAI